MQEMFFLSAILKSYYIEILTVLNLLHSCWGLLRKKVGSFVEIILLFKMCFCEYSECMGIAFQYPESLRIKRECALSSGKLEFMFRHDFS